MTSKKELSYVVAWKLDGAEQRSIFNSRPMANEFIDSLLHQGADEIMLRTRTLSHLGGVAYFDREIRTKNSSEA